MSEILKIAKQLKLAGSNVEKGLDSRIESRIGNVPTHLGQGSIYYCNHCGKEGGIVADEWMYTVQYQCDACTIKYGIPKNTIQIPDEIVRPSSKKP